MLELTTHCLYILLATRTYLLGKKMKIGWLFAMVASAGWAVVGVMIGLYSMMIWSTVFFVLDYRGYVRWRRQA